MATKVPPALVNKLGIAIAQALLITTAFNVHRARRTALRTATA